MNPTEQTLRFEASRVAFDEANHSYTIDDRWVPSVTQILKGALRFANVRPEVIEAASDRGKAAHRAVELIAKGRVIRPETIDPQVAPRLEAYLKFRRDSGFVAFGAEIRVAHLDLWYAGTLDLLGHFGDAEAAGVIDLCDIKTSAIVPFTVGPQTAGYAGALAAMGRHDMNRIRRWCVHLRPDGTYRLIRLRSANDWSIFCSALNLTRWCHDNRSEL